MQQYLYTYLNQKYGLKVIYINNTEFDNIKCKQYHIRNTDIFDRG